MGILDDYSSELSAFLAAQRQSSEQQRTVVVDALLLGLNDTLQETVFVGDPQTALVHHFGVEAFEDEVTTDRYMGLVNEINGHRGEFKVPLNIVKIDVVPVLVIEREKDPIDGFTSASTSLVMADTAGGGVKFKSTKEREEDVKMHVYTTKTAGVTTTELSLVGATSTIDVDVTDYRDYLPHPDSIRSFPELRLSKAVVADDGHGTGMPSDSAFTNYGSEMFESEPRIFVGFDAIDAVLAKSLSRGQSNALNLAQFLDTIKVLDLVSFLDNLPKSGPAILAGMEFQRRLGAIAGV